MQIKLTCAFTTFADLVGCIHFKVGAAFEHLRLWIETLLS